MPAKNRVCQNGAIVCDDAFANEAGKNQHQPVEEPVRIESAGLLDLWQQVSWFLDRTGDQVREQTDKETIVEKGPGGFNSSFINVHDIGHFLERVKRNAGRQDNANQGQRKIVNA